MVTTNTLQRLSLHIARQTLALELLSALVVWTGNLTTDSTLLSHSLRPLRTGDTACSRDTLCRLKPLHGFNRQPLERESARLLESAQGVHFADPPPRLWRRNGNHPDA